MIKTYLKFLVIAMLAMAPWAHAQKGISVQEHGYEVFYSVFNSKFITPEIANAHSLVRDKDQALLNIVVTRSDKNNPSLGLPATLTGKASNLIQQSQTLKFKTIKEQNTVYYLAPIKHTNEEVFNFTVRVSPEESEHSIDLKFSKKLYVEK